MENFDFLDKPSANHISNAFQQLYILGAVEEDKKTVCISRSNFSFYMGCSHTETNLWYFAHIVMRWISMSDDQCQTL